MASSSAFPAFRVLLSIKPCPRRRFSHPMKVKAQGFREEGRIFLSNTTSSNFFFNPFYFQVLFTTGRSRNLVDADMILLRKRMEEVRMKERLEKCCKRESGWNYAVEYNPKLRKDKVATELFKLLSLSLGTIAFTLLTCTVCLCLASLLAHM